MCIHMCKHRWQLSTQPAGLVFVNDLLHAVGGEDEYWNSLSAMRCYDPAKPQQGWQQLPDM